MEDKIRYAISKINKDNISQFEIYNKLYELDLIEDTTNILIIKKRFLESLLKLVNLKEYSMNVKNSILYIIKNEIGNKNNVYENMCFLIDNNCNVNNLIALPPWKFKMEQNVPKKI